MVHIIDSPLGSIIKVFNSPLSHQIAAISVEVLEWAGETFQRTLLPVGIHSVTEVVTKEYCLPEFQVSLLLGWLAWP